VNYNVEVNVLDSFSVNDKWGEHFFFLISTNGVNIEKLMMMDWYYGCYMWVNFNWMVWLKGRMANGLGFLIILISSYIWDLLLSYLHSWLVTN
jgi:hypothetical protein